MGVVSSRYVPELWVLLPPPVFIQAVRAEIIHYYLKSSVHRRPDNIALHTQLRFLSCKWSAGPALKGDFEKYATSLEAMNRIYVFVEALIPG